VALLKYKVSFGTHWVVVLIVVLMIKLHRDVLSLSVLETLVGEQVVVLVGVLMALNYHCNMLVLVGEQVVVLIVLMTLTYHHDVLLVLEVLIGEH
jgi:hypothetical protein